MEESRPSPAPGIALICYSLAFSLVKTCSPNGGRLSASPCLSALSRWLLLETARSVPGECSMAMTAYGASCPLPHIPAKIANI